MVQELFIFCSQTRDFATDPFGSSSRGFYTSGKDVADEPYSGQTRPIRPASPTVSENMGNVTRLRNIIVWTHHCENTNWQIACSSNAYITSQRYTIILGRCCVAKS